MRAEFVHSKARELFIQRWAIMTAILDDVRLWGNSRKELEVCKSERHGIIQIHYVLIPGVDKARSLIWHQIHVSLWWGLYLSCCFTFSLSCLFSVYTCSISAFLVIFRSCSITFCLPCLYSVFALLPSVFLAYLVLPSLFIFSTFSTTLPSAFLLYFQF